MRDNTPLERLPGLNSTLVPSMSILLRATVPPRDPESKGEIANRRIGVHPIM